MQFFFHPNVEDDLFDLLPEESTHCVKSLRKNAGARIFVTDGKGTLIEGELLNGDARGCTIRVLKRMPCHAIRTGYLHLCVAPTKNQDRMEWMTEKCVEMGIEKISFVQCDHSERVRMDLNRLTRIAIAAMKQSQTTLLPDMEMITFAQFMQQYAATCTDKLIAWCNPKNSVQLFDYQLKSKQIMLLIGPEGDFSESEIQQCRQQGFTEIKLGARRLRTETAALYGCAIIAGKLG